MSDPVRSQSITVGIYYCRSDPGQPQGRVSSREWGEQQLTFWKNAIEEGRTVAGWGAID